MLRHAVFITGTDTDVGKTRVSVGLLHAWGRRGLRTAACKPVAAGIPTGESVNGDVRALQAACTPPLAAEVVGPLQLQRPCAPNIAAALEGRTIELATLHAAAQAAATYAEVLLVEGAGGFCVPLTDRLTTADLAVRLALPVVMVVGIRLGCLNHALLTAEAVRARGLRLAGWIGNVVAPWSGWVDLQLSTLHGYLDDAGIPCLGTVPWLPEPTPDHVATHLHADRTLTAITLPPPIEPRPTAP